MRSRVPRTSRCSLDSSKDSVTAINRYPTTSIVIRDVVATVSRFTGDYTMCWCNAPLEPGSAWTMAPRAEGSNRRVYNGSDSLYWTERRGYHRRDVG